VLKSLILHQIGIVGHAEVAFTEGFTVITGETGSGKSLLIRAIGWVFGQRVAARDVVKTGCPQGRVELVFAPVSDKVRSELEAQGVFVTPDDPELWISREWVLSDSGGSSRCRVNGSPVNFGVLDALRPLLIDLHGQHELTSLFQPAYHRQCLDALGDNDFQGLKGTVAQTFAQWQQLKTQWETRQAELADIAKRRDYMAFQLTELEEAQLDDPLEDEQLHHQLNRLNQGEALKKATAKVVDLLKGGGQGYSVVDLLEKGQKVLSPVQEADPALVSFSDNLAGLVEEAKSLGAELNRYHHQVDTDGLAIQTIVERLDQLEKLKRKHGPTLANVIETRESFREQLTSDAQSEEDLSRLAAETKAAEQAFQHHAQVLSQQRQAISAQLQHSLIQELTVLALPAAQFQVQFQPSPPSENGLETIAFLFSANPGEPCKPLSKAASGGELSRFLLALKVLIARHSDVATLVFDEIDTGVSGPTARAVAERLQQLSKVVQTLVITHQPLIAVTADAHLHVIKDFVQTEDTHAVAVAIENLSADSERRMAILSRLTSGLDVSDAQDGALKQFIRQLMDEAKSASA